MILVFIFLVFIMGLVFSKVNVYIKSCYITNNSNGLNSKYSVKLKFYWFGVLPIFMVNFKNEELKILFFKINYKKIISNRRFRNKIEKAKNNFKISRIKLLKPEFQKLDLNLILGTESVEVTTFLVTVISFILSYWLKKQINIFDETKYKYIVKPNYNENNKIYLNFNAVFNVKTSNIIECIK